MADVKKFDCALLPPCARTLYKKVQRAHFVSIIWGNADLPYPGNGLDPVNYGWKKSNGYYAPEWFSGPPVPDDFNEEEELGDQSKEDHEKSQSGGTNYVADVTEDSNLDGAWSDDSDCEVEI